jgi:transposase-like protein
MPMCPQCQSDHVIKNGSATGKPKNQCKQCGYQFTSSPPVASSWPQRATPSCGI